MEESLLKESTTKKGIIEYAEKKGLLLNPDALKLLQDAGDYKKILDSFVEEKKFVIGKKDVSDKIIGRETKLGIIKKEVIVRKSSFKAKAKDLDANFKILKKYDVTNQSNSGGSVDDFLNYFRDKYKFLSSLLKQRMRFEPISISALKGIQKNQAIDLIGMVGKKWVSKKGHQIILFEDIETECIGVISKENRQLTQLGGTVLLDDVIGIKATKISDEMVIINEIFWPDIPQKPLKKADNDVNMAVFSDMHVGSKLFLEKEFNKFISWLNGNLGSKKEIDRVGKIKYAVIAGDNVDGIGIYPEQYDELAIKDIYEQYEKFSELISRIPEYIDVFICPGQHDAVRRADPQPAIPKEFVKELYSLGNVHFIGSPGWIEIEGLKTLVYHGASLHDLYASVNFLSQKEPQNAMKELLKRRDLMPTYGMRQPYVPEKKDFMLIREEPDLYIGGDMHHNGYTIYRSCLVVNSGTWQTRTEFQIKEGHIPTPGIVTEINLKSRKIRENYFYKEGV